MSSRTPRLCRKIHRIPIPSSLHGYVSACAVACVIAPSRFSGTQKAGTRIGRWPGWSAAQSRLAQWFPIADSVVQKCAWSTCCSATLRANVAKKWMDQRLSKLFSSKHLPTGTRRLADDALESTTERGLRCIAKASGNDVDGHSFVSEQLCGKTHSQFRGIAQGRHSDGGFKASCED